MSAAAGAGTVALKVTVGDHWMPLQLAASPGDTVAAVKGRALATLRLDASGGGGEADRYEVKYGGARIADESVSLSALRIGTGAALVVLLKRRRPVR